MSKMFLICVATVSVATGICSAQVPAPELVAPVGGMAMGTQTAFASDGNWVALAGFDSIGHPSPIKIFDTTSGRIGRILDTSGSIIMAHPSLPQLAVVGAAGALSVVDVPSGKTVWKVQNAIGQNGTEKGHNVIATCLGLAYVSAGTLRSLCFNLQQISKFRMNAELRVTDWDAATGHAIAQYPVIKGGASQLTLDGTLIVMPREATGRKGDFETRTALVDAISGREIQEIRGQIIALSAPLQRAAVLVRSNPKFPNSPLVLTIMELQTGKRTDLGQHADPAGIAGFASISANQEAIVLRGITSSMFVDLKAKKALPLQGISLVNQSNVALSPTGDRLAIMDGAGTLTLRASGGSGGTATGGLVEGRPPASPVQLAPITPTEITQKKPAKIGTSEAIATLREQQTARVEGFITENHTFELEYAKTISRFGTKSIVIPAAKFIGSSQFLAVRSADTSWSVWSARDGNPIAAPGVPDLSPEQLLSRMKAMSNKVLAFDGRDLVELESQLTGSPQRVRRRPPPAYKGTPACYSPDKMTVVSVELTDGKASRAYLYVNGSQDAVDLTLMGISILAFTPPPQIRGVPRQLPFGIACSISDDGTLLAVEGPTLPDANARGKNGSRPQRLKGVATPITWAPSASIAIYDLNTQKLRSLLENEPGKTSFGFVPGQLRFNPSGEIVFTVVDENAQLTGSIADGRLWNSLTGKQVSAEVPLLADILGYSADSQQYYTREPADSSGAMTYGVGVWDAKTRKRLFTLPDALSAPGLITAAPSGSILIAPDKDNALGLWDRQTGSRVGTLFAFQEHEWLVTTPSGLFDGSPRGWSQLSWRNSSDQLTTSPSEVFLNEFYRPGLLKDLLAGKPPTAPRTTNQVDRRQPLVILTAEAAATDGRTGKVRLSVRRPLAAKGDRKFGARDLRLFRNGLLVRSWRGELPFGDDDSIDFTAEVALVSGENRLSAYAFNQDNVKSGDSQTVIRSSAASRRGVAHILAIGVNRYANAGFNLLYAVADAERLSNQLAQRLEGTGRYAEQEVAILTDSEATKSNIRLAFSILGGGGPSQLPAGTPASLSNLHKVEPEDAVILYFAGHGFALADHFYLVPHDLGYGGLLEQLQGSISTVAEHSIGDQELEKWLEPIQPAQMALIIDACQSGQLLESEEWRRGPMNSRGLAQLAYEKGMYVLAASQAYQAALEAKRLGHGYLTYALVEEGLQTAVADIMPKDRQVTASEWFDFAVRRVPQLHAEAGQRILRQETAIPKATPAPSAPVRPEIAPGLQTPRVFYRRETEGTLPWIVAKPPFRTGSSAN